MSSDNLVTLSYDTWDDKIRDACVATGIAGDKALRFRGQAWSVDITWKVQPDGSATPVEINGLPIGGAE